jgi:hypothetical protein
MIWNPAQHGGRMPRLQVHDAWAELAGTYELERVYCDPGFNDPHDPTSWITEIEMWDRVHGPETFVPWQMGGQTRTRAVHAALVRFEADLRSGGLSTTAARSRRRTSPTPASSPSPVTGSSSASRRSTRRSTPQSPRPCAMRLRSDARTAGWGAPKPSRRMVVR